MCVFVSVDLLVIQYMHFCPCICMYVCIQVHFYYACISSYFCLCVCSYVHTCMYVRTTYFMSYYMSATTFLGIVNMCMCRLSLCHVIYESETKI